MYLLDTGFERASDKMEPYPNGFTICFNCDRDGPTKEFTIKERPFMQRIWQAINATG